jgi:hypothetical protein
LVPLWKTRLSLLNSAVVPCHWPPIRKTGGTASGLNLALSMELKWEPQFRLSLLSQGQCGKFTQVSNQKQLWFFWAI